MAKCLVTGAGGFVGNALCRALTDLGHQVLAVTRREILNLREVCQSVIMADLQLEPEKLAPYLAGVDAVFHTAAKVDLWGDYADFYSANFIVTKQLLELCQQNRVEKFIYTSSPSVVANGKDLAGVNESTPYPDHYESNYPKTKALAEQLVLSSNGKCGLLTVALRPHLIFGPGDTNLIPTIIKKARAGKLVQLGQGENLVDFTYIHDCVLAHIAAFQSLSTNPRVAGKAYFISQGEPTPLWQWVNKILLNVGMPPINRKIPVWLGRMIATGSEVATKLGLTSEPSLSNFLVTEMSTSHYFDISAAKSDLGYRPKFSIDSALAETFKWLEQAKEIRP